MREIINKLVEEKQNTPSETVKAKYIIGKVEPKTNITRCVICGNTSRVMVDGLYQPIKIPHGFEQKISQMRKELKSIPICIDCMEFD